MRGWGSLGLVIILAGLLTGCAPTARRGTTRTAAGNRVQIKGSDTMVNLNQAWAETYMHAHPRVSIMVTGGGSGTGIAALTAGTTDIAACSRQITPDEIAAATKAGHTPEAYTVALDGIAVIVHPANPVKTLTLDQLAAIFTGQATDWSQVGGSAGKILLLGREVNSGTHVFFKEHVLQRGNSRSTADYAKSTLYLSSSQAIVTEVEQNRQAIGYVGLGYVRAGTRTVPIAKAKGTVAVVPSQDSVRSGRYPIARPLYYYTSGTPSGSVKDLIDFVLSPAGQQVVREQDFVPLK